MIDTSSSLSRAGLLGFVKKANFSQWPCRWLTVISPEDPEGTELQLALNDGRDRLHDRHAERYLRQSHSGDAAEALVGRT